MVHKKKQSFRLQLEMPVAKKIGLVAIENL
jgi:hypothetical protein